MAVLLYHMFAFTALFTYGLYHVACSARSHLLSRPYAARPYYPLPLSPHRPHLLRHLPLYLSLFSLLLSLLHSLVLFFSPSFLPLRRLSSLHTSLVLLLFLLLALSLLLSHSHPHLLPLPADLLFLLAALAFALLATNSYPSPSSSPDLQSKCDAVSATVSAASALLSLALALNPRLFVAELALAASVSLQGLWSLQTGLSLYAEAFIPEGCHRLLDVPGGIDGGSTWCELEESRLRAAALLDLFFVMHAAFVAVVAVAVYAIVARASGVGVRRVGSYEALPTSLSSAALNETGTASPSDHLQMKAIGKTTMQE